MIQGDPASNKLIEEMESLRRHSEQERRMIVRLLHLASSPNDLHGLMRQATGLLGEWSGCDAVGIRLRDGDDFPYFETRGFPAEFIQAENSLCVRDLDDQLARDPQGNPVLECMCGNILCGRFNPDLPFFTPGGSFWSNCTTELLANTTEADRQARTRNRCNGEGYESVALIPLRSGGETFGLLQLNDRRAGRFTAEMIVLFEGLGAALAEAIARRHSAEGLRSSRDQLPSHAQSLRRGEAYFRLLYEEAPLGYQSLDAQGHFLEVNQAWLDLLGYSRGEVIGKSFAGFLTPAGRELFVQRFPRFKEVGEAHGVEFQMVRKDATVIAVSFDGRISRDSSGQFLRTHCILHDITERKRAEEAVQKERDYTQSIIGAMADMLVVVAPDGKIATVNAATCQSLGYLERELIGQAATLLFDEDEDDDDDEDTAPLALSLHALPIKRTLLRRLVKQGSIRNVEKSLRTKGGLRIPVLLSGSVMRGEAGEIRGIVCLALDITARKADEDRFKAMELQLSHASRLATIGELVAGLAHEVNQPLCTIVNYAKACKNAASRETPDLSKISQWSDAIAAAAVQSGDTVRRILDFARRREPVRKTVSLRQIVDDAMLLVRHEARKRKIKLQQEISERELAVSGDPVQICQVLVNLLRNGLDACGDARSAKSRITVFATRLEDEIQVAVSDNGPGLPEADLPKIFDPFFTTKSQGLGLGLPISKTIIETHGGRICATTNQDGGLTLHFTLPAGKE